MLHQIIAQSNNYQGFQPITTPSEVFNATDSSLDNFLWFNGYRTADYTGLTIDTNYFFLYSSDHDNDGVYLGKANNLNCSDFVEAGKITVTASAETPHFLQIDAAPDSDKLHLFCHGSYGGSITQETKLFTTSGGDLLTSTWTDRGTVLGVEVDETHTGYTKVFTHQNDGFRAVHLTVGGTSAEYKFSSSSDGRTFTRDGVVDLHTYMPTGYELKASYGNYFKKFGKHWFIGTIETLGAIVGSIDKNIILAKTDVDMNITELVSVIDSTNRRNTECYVEGNTAHLYITNTEDSIHYSTFDLNQLQYL